MGTIIIEDALKAIDSGKIVSIRYVSFDKKRKSGGKIKTIDQAIVTNPQQIQQSQKKSGSTYSGQSYPSRNPNNKEHSTRNFSVCINGNATSSIRKVHIFLLLELNGKKVML